MLPWQHFYQGVLGQKFQLFVKMVFFSFKTYLYRIFLARIRNQRLRIDPCAKFQLHWTKDKETRILTWNSTKNGLMTSHLLLVMTSAKFLWFLRDFVPDYHHAEFGSNWTTNKGETEGGTMCPPPAYMVPKDPSLNRVKQPH